MNTEYPHEIVDLSAIGYDKPPFMELFPKEAEELKDATVHEREEFLKQSSVAQRLEDAKKEYLRQFIK